MSTFEERQRKQRRPKLGRQVSYLDYDEGPRAAIVTDVLQDRMDSDLSLLVLFRGKAVSIPLVNYGTDFGQWQWMEE